jgi:hypothetical protein
MRLQCSVFLFLRQLAGEGKEWVTVLPSEVRQQSSCASVHKGGKGGWYLISESQTGAGRKS